MQKKSLTSQMGLSSLMLGAGSAVAGTAAADLPGNAETLPASICILFAMAAQLTANLYRRYYMENKRAGVELGWRFPTRPANDNAMALRACSIVALFVTLTLGFMLVTMGGWWVGAAGAAVLLLGWLCAGGPRPVMRSPWSPLAAFIMFGPVCVGLTAMIQIVHDYPDPMSRVDTDPVLFAACVIGLMAVNATLVHNYYDHDSDIEAERHSVATVFGLKTTRALVFANGLVYTAVMVWSCFALDLDNSWVATIAPLICFIINIYVWDSLKRYPATKSRHVINVSNLNVLLMGIMMLILARALGDDDTSQKTYFGTLCWLLGC